MTLTADCDHHQQQQLQQQQQLVWYSCQTRRCILIAAQGRRDNDDAVN